MRHMRKLILAAAALLASALVALAIPAYPGIIRYTQPDGSVVELRLHGDEFFHWTTLAGSDQVVVLGDDGFYHPGAINPADMQDGALRRRQVNLARQRVHADRELRGTHNQDPLTHGQRHIPVFLVQFQDVPFSLDNIHTVFDNLLNQPGYSYDGATGSVRDYYYQNSHGAFDPIFDVYGPMTLSEPVAYYGHNVNVTETSNGKDSWDAYLAVIEAARYYDSQVDFSQYDDNNDGKVDMIMMYFAGYNEAEGGHRDTIWPHQSTVSEDVTLDGKKLGTYFCTSELKDYSGTNLCGIGTSCHEFGHSLGLPDFYDTDYETNGKAGGLYWFSLMCSGSYNNGGRTPPYFNAEERIFLGWMSEDDILELPDSPVEFSSVKDDIAYKVMTETEGEMFIFECRDGSGWDTYVPEGMVAYHLDHSPYHLVGGYSASELWYNWGMTNIINAYGDHPCFYVVPAYDPTELNSKKPMSDMVFPGNANIQEYAPVDWSGNQVGVVLSNIAYSAGKVSMTVETETPSVLLGMVENVNGRPMKGVTIQISDQGQQASGVTGDDGSFRIALDGFSGGRALVAASLDGYQTSTMEVDLTARVTHVRLVLTREGESRFSYFNENATSSGIGAPEPQGRLYAAIRIPASDLAGVVGYRMEEIAFNQRASQGSLWVFAQTDTGMVLFEEEVPSFSPGWNYVDLSHLKVGIPADRDLYVGYALSGSDVDFPFKTYAGWGNLYNSAAEHLSRTTLWAQCPGWDLACSLMVAPGEVNPETPDEGIHHPYAEIVAAMGFNVLYPGRTFEHSAGEKFPLHVFASAGDNKPQSIEWLYDGEATTEQSVVLTAGVHTVTARLTLADGRLEILTLELNVE